MSRHSAPPSLLEEHFCCHPIWTAFCPRHGFLQCMVICFAHDWHPQWQNVLSVAAARRVHLGACYRSRYTVAASSQASALATFGTANEVRAHPWHRHQAHHFAVSFDFGSGTASSSASACC